jgi:hypothetical protein
VVVLYTVSRIQILQLSSRHTTPGQRR